MVQLLKEIVTRQHELLWKPYQCDEKIQNIFFFPIWLLISTYIIDYSCFISNAGRYD